MSPDRREVVVVEDLDVGHFGQKLSGFFRQFLYILVKSIIFLTSKISKLL
jgi:hypothetical protein